jgi:hypothetical protein
MRTAIRPAVCILAFGILLVLWWRVPSDLGRIQVLKISGLLSLALVGLGVAGVLVASGMQLFARPRFLSLLGVLGLVSLGGLGWWASRYTDLGILVLGGDAYWVERAATATEKEDKAAALGLALEGTEYALNTVETLLLERYADQPNLQAELFEILSGRAEPSQWAQQYRERRNEALARAGLGELPLDPAFQWRNVSVEKVDGAMAEKSLEVGVDLEASMEEEFRKWDAATEPTQEPPGCLRAPEVSPLATWEAHYDSLISLSFWKGKDFPLEMSLYTEGHLMSWRLRRHAIQTGDRIQLDGPVRGYFPTGTFSRLYLIEVEGLPYLLPSVHVRCAHEVAEEVGCEGLRWENVGGCLLRQGP